MKSGVETNGPASLPGVMAAIRGMRRAWQLLRGRQEVHFLHLGKTGGTAVKHALQEHTRLPRYRLHLHPHHVRLKDVPVGERFMFFLRDPVSRFVSAFYSRQREGKPRYHVPWSDGERAAFERFAGPNALALGLVSADAGERAAAEAAMRAIQHVCESYWDWFGSPDYLRARLPDLFLVGTQENLAADFERLKSKLGLPAETSLPNDDVAAHRNPETVDRRLEPAAVEALRRWYARDYELMWICGIG